MYLQVFYLWVMIGCSSMSNAFLKSSLNLQLETCSTIMYLFYLPCPMFRYISDYVQYTGPKSVHATQAGLASSTCGHGPSHSSFCAWDKWYRDSSSFLCLENMFNSSTSSLPPHHTSSNLSSGPVDTCADSPNVVNIRGPCRNIHIHTYTYHKSLIRMDQAAGASLPCCSTNRTNILSSDPSTQYCLCNERKSPLWLIQLHKQVQQSQSDQGGNYKSVNPFG